MREKRWQNGKKCKRKNPSRQKGDGGKREGQNDRREGGVFPSHRERKEEEAKVNGRKKLKIKISS